MKYFSMFSGVEGFGQGINGELMGFSEIDKYASMVLKYRFPNIINYGDCSKIRWEEIPDFDLLTGGSPCQDFSIAGKRRGLASSKSALAWEFIRGLRSKQPRYFIWENVKGVMSSRSGWDFANIITAFSESGYSLWWQVLNAKDFGVPQNRERIFVIGFREGSPKEIFFEFKTEENSLEESGTICKTLLASYPANSNGNFIKVGDNIRKLTEIECERLMSWPDDWTRWGRKTDKECLNCAINQQVGSKQQGCSVCVVEISDSQRYKMCGNGVVSNVIKEIVKLFQ